MSEGTSDDLAELRKCAAKVCEGFDRGIFCRDISGDHRPGWAVTLLPYLVALGRLSEMLGVHAGEDNPGDMP